MYEGKVEYLFREYLYISNNYRGKYIKAYLKKCMQFYKYKKILQCLQTLFKTKMIIFFQAPFPIV